MQNSKPTFALTSWTVEERRDGWYYGDTYGDEPKKFRGPYTSIRSVTLMIAREMTKEITRRQERFSQILTPSPAE